VTGFSVVFLIVELGKLAFGKIRHRFAEPEEFEWRREGESATLRIGNDTMDWGEIFSRSNDKLTLVLERDADIDGAKAQVTVLEFFHNRLMIQSETRNLMEISKIHGRATSVVIPREAMGFGDVKFMACIGAFLGWQGVLFTLFAGSVVGSAVGLAGLFLARDRSGVRLPFGPFLAVGALIWLFGGQRLFDWYFMALEGLAGSVF
jgi:leader peptidase (prepilin peptidase)/N-methyltransferase